ncbi:MAG: glycoside hydrolase family 2 TIM barrel-domain containing protein [Christensenellales bacterium]|jgi:hypothetical protein
MQRLSHDARLTPLPASGRVWPLAIDWEIEGENTATRQVDGGAAMPEYGRNQGSVSDAGLTLTGRFGIPGDAAGKLLLRFDSVGCFAEVFIKGRPVGIHTGSHTVWECPLEARPGEMVNVTLWLKGGENVFSPYQTAGILRGISLVEVPSTHIAKCVVHADRRDGDAALRMEYALEDAEPLDMLTAVLYASDGGIQGQWTIELNNSGTAELTVPSEPKITAWDAEHPALYRLVLTLRRENAVLETVEKRVGFTDIQKVDPLIFWNGKALKLRGINYREPFPREGRNLRKELQALKDAHVNYLRSMYYPYSEACLDLCDELGFYVEQCAPFQEVGQGIASTQNTPAEMKGYVSQFSEMLRDGISHPCVAIWSLGGDSAWGSNFRHCYRLAKEMDPKRPVNFFYAMTVPEEEPEMDIWSVQFVDWRQPMDKHYDQMVIFHTHGANNEIGYEVGSAQSRKPVLHQMYAPPACYNRDEIERDYGIREFWGQGIGRFWDAMWKSEGCLGGAVLAATDENGTFSPRLKDFNWGVLDGQGNPKPEYHHLRMAYAPIVLENLENQKDGLALQIINRFCHTDLNELSCRWQKGKKNGSFQIYGAPGESVTALLPKLWQTPEDEINLVFEAAGFTHLIVIPASVQTAQTEPGINGGAYTLEEDTSRAVLFNRLYRFVFDKQNGCLTEASVEGELLLLDGPFLQTTRLTLGKWHGTLENAAVTDDGARVKLLGAYGDVCRVRFTLDIQNDGTVDTHADILTLSKPMPHSVKAGVGIDPGGLNEWGIAWLAAPGYESLSWQRNTLLSWYPGDHIGRAKGEANRENRKDFSSMKHDVNTAALRYLGARIVVLGDGGMLSVRAEAQDDPAFVLDDRDERIVYTGTWREMDDYCGNYAGTETLSDEQGATAELRFIGSGVRVYGPNDFLYGNGAASVDGGEATPFCQYMDKVDLPGASRGYEKRYGQPLYEVHHLPEGPHTLRIEVKGESPSGAQGTYVSLDRIVVESEHAKGPVRLILNRDYNYARLVRGNYMRPRVAFSAGDSVSAAIRLHGGKADENGRKDL